MMKPIVPAIILLTQLVACDDVVNVQNRAPFVSDIDVCHDDGRLFWEVQLGDPEEDPTDVALILDVPSDANGIIASGPRATVGPGPAGVGLVGLITSKGNNDE